MSISIGIYDLFSYTIPGFLYLYVFNEFLHLIGWEYFQFDKMEPGSELITAALAILCAYAVGHLMDYFANWFCYRLLTRYKIKGASLAQIKQRYPDLNIQFETRDTDPLFTNLRMRNLEFSRVIDSYGANNIMLRNISLGLLMLALLQIWGAALDFRWQSLVLIFGALALSRVAYLRSRMFYHWFFTDIFEASLEYGTNLKEVIEHNRKHDKKETG